MRNKNMVTEVVKSTCNKELKLNAFEQTIIVVIFNLKYIFEQRGYFWINEVMYQWCKTYEGFLFSLYRLT